ncbi:MAG: hypothetical protein R6W75_07735, partial [Smithellaceae bacterium]
MTDMPDEYRIARWRAEFVDRRTEQAFQRRMQKTINRQLRIALIVWSLLMLLFAVPDYMGLGLTQPFYYLLTYRIFIFLALITVIFKIRPETDYYKISAAVAIIVVASFSGFMLFFVFRPNVIIWVVGVIMVLIIALLIFIPIRFCLAFLC